MVKILLPSRLAEFPEGWDRKTPLKKIDLDIRGVYRKLSDDYYMVEFSDKDRNPLILMGYEPFFEDNTDVVCNFIYEVCEIIPLANICAIE